MAEQAKGSGPEWNGLRTGPTTSSDTSRSTPGDQFHLLSQPNSDRPSDLTSSRDTDLALGEPETLMALFSESDAYENAREHWESDHYQPKNWSFATIMTMIALVAIAIAIAIAIPLVFLESNRPSADATAQQIVVPKKTATETAPAAARQSGETLVASAEQNRPRDPTNGRNSGLTPDDTAADTKSVGPGQNAPPQALAATQSPTRLVDKEELAKGLTPDNTAADTKSMDQGQNAPPQALAATQSPASLIDKEVLAKGLTPDDTAADAKSVGQGQNAPPQALAATQSPASLIDKEVLAKGLTSDDTAAESKSAGQAQNAPPQAPAAAQSLARTIDKEELASLLKRGRYLLSIADIASARLLLERAADAHDASAAFDLAGTYDPAVLARSHVLGIAPDLAMARMWYEKALNLGHSEAQQRLVELQK